jgi:hypothetical protein
MSARTWRRKRCYEPTEPPITEMARAHKDFPALTCLGLRVRVGVMAAPGRSLAGWSCLGSARVSGSAPRGAGLGLEVLRRGPSACLLSTRSGLGLACSGQVTVEEFTPFYLPRAAPQGQSPRWGASVRVWTFETHKPPISDFAEHSRVFVAEGA